MYLVCVDAHSKFMDVHAIYFATSSNTTEKLRILFATHGLPESIEGYNGTPFTSE